MDLIYIENEAAIIKGIQNFPSKDKMTFLGPLSGGEKIRRELTSFQLSSMGKYFADTGDCTPDGVTELKNVIHELNATGGPVISCISTKIGSNIHSDFLSNYSHPVVVTNKPQSWHNGTRCLGVQSHYYHPSFKFDIHKHVRLGDLRNNMEKAEVMLRTADLVWIDLGVLRLGDNIGHIDSSSAGLMIEELCMIAKYAGASTHLATVILSGYDENRDSYGLFAKNVALILYYLTEGFDIQQKHKSNGNDYQRYTVIPDDISSELVFIEDRRNGRWWVELYSETAEKEVKIACTKSDYENACDNFISDRITSLIATV